MFNIVARGDNTIHSLIMLARIDSSSRVRLTSLDLLAGPCALCAFIGFEAGLPRLRRSRRTHPHRARNQRHSTMYGHTGQAHYGDPPRGNVAHQQVPAICKMIAVLPGCQHIRLGVGKRSVQCHSELEARMSEEHH